MHTLDGTKFVKCGVRPDIRKTENGKSMEVFGLEIKLGEGERDITVADISPSREFVTTLAQRINEYQVSPLHIMDIIVDAVAEAVTV